MYQFQRPLSYFGLLFILGGFFSCQTASTDAPASSVDEDSTSIAALALPDSAVQLAEQLAQDSIAYMEDYLANGYQQKLGKGFIVSFPGKPRRSKGKNPPRTTYNYEKSEYAFLVSQTDLSKDSTFLAHRQERRAYYKALALQNANRIDADITAMYTFDIVNLYKGLGVRLEREDLAVDLRLMLMGTQLYTQAVIWYEAPDADKLQMADAFFDTFNKELYIE